MPTISLTPVFFFNDPATSEIYTLSQHDALPISAYELADRRLKLEAPTPAATPMPTVPDSREVSTSPYGTATRSEEHTSELQSQSNLVCRLLLEKTESSQRRTYTHSIEHS